MIAILLGILQLGIATPPAGRCVLDEAGVLSDSEVSSLEAGCQLVRNRLYVVTVSDTRGQGDQFARTLFNSWGTRSDSALVMVAPRERKWRIVVGSSLRGVISDAKAMDVGRTYGVPAFRNQLWGTGLISIEHSLTPLMAMGSVTPIAPVVTKRTTTTTTRRVVAPVYTTPVVHHLSAGMVLLTVLMVMCLIFFLWWLMVAREDDREERARQAREDEMARRRAAAQPVPKWEDPYPAPRTPYPSSSYPRPAPVVAAPTVIPIPVVQPVPIPVVVPSYTPGFTRSRSYYAPGPIVIIDEPVLPVAPIIEERTTTVVEETVSTPDSGGAGGGWSSSDDDSGGGGGSFDSGSSDSGGSSDDGGGGGDF